MQSLSELLERVRAATGPDREIDRRIATALGYTAVLRPAYYTASLDAIVALIERELPGQIGGVDFGNPEGCMAHIGRLPWRTGRTPALALCAAFLSAKIAMEAPDKQA